MGDEFQWQQWISLLTAIAGLLVGAALSEVKIVLAGARERRRALNVLLFDLLELRRDIRAANPRLLIDTLLSVARRKFGAEAAAIFGSPDFRAIISSLQKELVGSDRIKLTDRYQNALRSLVPYDPLLAYRLAGSDGIVKLEHATALYYEKVAQHPEVVKDANAPRLLRVMEDETTTALIGEVIGDLAADIKLVARARRWWPFRFAWIPFAVRSALHRQDSVSTREAERELDQFIDRVLPGVISALATATESQP